MKISSKTFPFQYGDDIFSVSIRNLIMDNMSAPLKGERKKRHLTNDGSSIEIMFLMQVIMQARNEKCIIRGIEIKQK